MLPVATLRRHALILMWLVTIPLAGFFVVIAAVVGQLVWNGGRFADAVAIFYLPVLLYIWAIWMMRSALKSVANGEMFVATVPTLMFRIGLALLGGALFTVFGIPLLTFLRDGRPYLQTFDGSAVTLGIVGATLALVAQLLTRAAAMREELDGFV